MRTLEAAPEGHTVADQVEAMEEADTAVVDQEATVAAVMEEAVEATEVRHFINQAMAAVTAARFLLSSASKNVLFQELITTWLAIWANRKVSTRTVKIQARGALGPRQYPDAINRKDFMVLVQPCVEVLPLQWSRRSLEFSG